MNNFVFYALENKPLTLVSETLLKKRKKRAEQKAKAIQNAVRERKKQRQRKKGGFKSAEKLVKEYRRIERDNKRLKWAMRCPAKFDFPTEHRLGFIIRIRGSDGVCSRTSKILDLLKLRAVNIGVFVEMNEAMLQLLKVIEPFVTWGYPNLKTVRELIYKRGYGRAMGRRFPLSDNAFIEERLGKYGIVCLEDLLHQLYTIGPHFKKVANFLWKFKLNPPKNGWTKKSLRFTEGGDYGNRDIKINDLLRKMI
ncbi:60S ribosomal protein L7-like isoform X1 [Limulus polyphemus]|uniref:60S ribosomal protein L7-like isoform X1 n=1 Tax=Limulus polyphemus TaxID=6850 RepID=A0ABM1SPW7_LIMPO|nr:60S ribosomal protein L7-like isoform X1 [Limulus polyphemus]